MPHLVIASSVRKTFSLSWMVFEEQVFIFVSPVLVSTHLLAILLAFESAYC